MTFEEAKNFKMPWGQHEGKTIDEVAVTDRGLRYLDWLVGETTQEPVRTAIATYLADPAISEDLAALR